MLFSGECDGKNVILHGIQRHGEQNLGFPAGSFALSDRFDLQSLTAPVEYGRERGIILNADGKGMPLAHPGWYGKFRRKDRRNRQKYHTEKKPENVLHASAPSVLLSTASTMAARRPSASSTEIFLPGSVCATERRKEPSSVNAIA